jgi:hypothetical protein
MVILSLLLSLLFSLRVGQTERPSLCKIKLILESFDHRLDCSLAQLSSGDLIHLSQIQFDYLSISSATATASSPSSLITSTSMIVFNLTARFSSLSNSTLLVMSRLMSLCTSKSLFPSLTVNEVRLLPQERRCGYLKVRGQLHKYKKRERTTDADPITDDGDGETMLLLLIDPPPSPLTPHELSPPFPTTSTLRCLFHPKTISSLDSSSFLNFSSMRRTVVMTLVPQLRSNQSGSSEELTYRIECLSEL